KAFEHDVLVMYVFLYIITDINEVGYCIIDNPIPCLISITCSTPVGRHIGKVAGEHLKKVALELGGNSPFVVLGDAVVDRAVDAAIFGKFVHNGQICMATNRIIVHQYVYDEFVEKFVTKAKGLQV